MALSSTAARWFETRRGIRRETLEAYGVTTDGEATVFQYPSGAKKFRKGFEKDERRFWWEPPTMAGQVPYLPPNFAQSDRMILVEGETDAMALWQNVPDDLRDKVVVVGLSGTDAWKERYVEEVFGQARRVFVVLDNDDPYENADAAKSVERGWQKIRADLGRKARRVQLPQGINDLAEFFMRYDWAAFQVLLQKAAEPKRHYKRLDLTKPVPDTDWLVEDFLVCGEVTVMAADSGVGKSWINMALGLAVAGGEDTFLGLKIRRHGAVMIVDEENPGDLVHQRLHALGFDPGVHLPNLEYLWHAGVDLANEADKLHEEALDIQPELIVLDSLSRVALGVEENDNTAMSLLFKKSLVPLARDTGAAVVVIHHTPSDNAGKPRGAGAIKAAADEVLSLVAAETKGGVKTGTINIFPSKPRRQLTHLSARIEGDMEKDGVVRVKEITEEAPF